MKTIKALQSIKAKILTAMISTIFISLTLVGGISCILGYIGTMSTLEDSMTETAAISAERVSYQLQNYMTIAMEAGSMS